MPTSKRVWSVRAIFMQAIVGFIAITGIISLTIMTKQLTGSFEQLISTDVEYWANTVSSQSIHFLRNNDKEKLKTVLTITEKIPHLSYLHIYRKNAEQKFDLFYSYQRSERRSAISEKTNGVNELSTPKFRTSYVEYMHPIQDKEQVIGYVYIQSNTDHISAFNNSFITLAVAIITVMLLISVFVAFQLERYIGASFYSLVNIIQTATKRKDFTLACPPMPYREADILARNINILFGRMEKHIKQLGIAEQQSIEHSHELEHKINKRTAALKESNQELLSTLEKLHQFQGQLVESEKMASLGDMVAGVAHEVNTPIGLGVTASTLLGDRLNEIKDAFEDKTLKSSQLKKFLHEGDENIAIIYRNLNRAADLISSFKKVAVDQSSEDVRQFNVRELLTEVLMTLRPQLSTLSHNINIECPEDLLIISKPGPINQILINLIMNSVIHGFEFKDEGTISISVMSLSNQLNIIFTDDGKGVDESIKKKIFEPFTTTKRGEGGSGLGLHLVYNLVTQALGGTIILTSEENNGVNFEINFPIN